MGKTPLILNIEKDALAIKRAVAIIEGDGIVAYPTETFFALGVDPFSDAAVKRLFELKGRAPENPVPLIISDRRMLSTLAEVVPGPARRLMDKHWPGPLTIVVTARNVLPTSITAGTGSVGVRVSSSKTARALSANLGSAITATSANPSGKDPARSAEETLLYFGDSIDAIIEGGAPYEGPPSTIVDATGGRLSLIREGAVPASDLQL